MKCSNKTCNKLYDLKCLAIQQQLFEDFTDEYKEKWVCPECCCTNPKRSNVNTPVRTPGITKSYTSDFDNVNMQRGSCKRTSLDALQSEDETKLLAELRVFRMEVISRLDNQATEIKQLRDLCYSVKTELCELQTKMRVIEEKIIRDDKHNTPVDGLTSRKQQWKNLATTGIKGQLSEAAANIDEKSKITYAEVMSGSIKNNNDSVVLVTQDKSNGKFGKGGATKTVKELPLQNYVTTVPTVTTETNSKVRGNEDNWTMVTKKQNRRQSKEIIRGQNTSVTHIQAIERMKHLHVWRLHPETTVESLSTYVRAVCGSEVTAKIEKVNHKTERGYASFIVGVPETFYNQLSQPSVWPVNVELSEWIWFRRYNKHPYKAS